MEVRYIVCDRCGKKRRDWGNRLYARDSLDSVRDCAAFADIHIGCWGHILDLCPECAQKTAMFAMGIEPSNYDEVARKLSEIEIKAFEEAVESMKTMQVNLDLWDNINAARDLLKKASGADQGGTT